MSKETKNKEIEIQKQSIEIYKIRKEIKEFSSLDETKKNVLLNKIDKFLNQLDKKILSENGIKFSEKEKETIIKFMQ